MEGRLKLICSLLQAEPECDDHWVVDTALMLVGATGWWKRISFGLVLLVALRSDQFAVYLRAREVLRTAPAGAAEDAKTVPADGCAIGSCGRLPEC